MTSNKKTLCKRKALTTKWDFTIGIEEALSGLDQQLLQQVDRVALSTTLATNAIVEGNARQFQRFKDADTFARKEITRLVRDRLWRPVPVCGMWN